MSSRAIKIIGLILQKLQSNNSIWEFYDRNQIHLYETKFTSRTEEEHIRKIYIYIYIYIYICYIYYLYICIYIERDIDIYFIINNI